MRGTGEDFLLDDNPIAKVFYLLFLTFLVCSFTLLAQRFFFPIISAFQKSKNFDAGAKRKDVKSCPIQKSEKLLVQARLVEIKVFGLFSTLDWRRFFLLSYFYSPWHRGFLENFSSPFFFT